MRVLGLAVLLLPTVAFAADHDVHWYATHDGPRIALLRQCHSSATLGNTDDCQNARRGEVARDFGGSLQETAATDTTNPAYYRNNSIALHSTLSQCATAVGRRFMLPGECAAAQLAAKSGAK